MNLNCFIYANTCLNTTITRNNEQLKMGSRADLELVSIVVKLQRCGLRRIVYNIV